MSFDTAMDVGQAIPSTLAPLQQSRDQIYTDFSPVSLYGSLEDFNNTDFSADSPLSPGSPLSATANTYTLPGPEEEEEEDDENGSFVYWKNNQESPDPGLIFKSEPGDDDYEDNSRLLAAIPRRNISVSPAINPLELSNSLSFVGTANLNGNGSVFQPTRPAAMSEYPPIQEEQQQQQQQQLNQAPTAMEASNGYPTGGPQPLPQAGAGTGGEEPQHRYPTRASRGSLKRKTSSASSRSSASPPPIVALGSPRSMGSGSPPPPRKKTAHNVIEKRYRTNLNDKIAALRDAIPALRGMAHNIDAGHETDSGDDDSNDVVILDRGYRLKAERDEMGDDLDGLMPTHKLNKATILGKATEYIAHLEHRNRVLAQENKALRSRVEGFEILVTSRGGQAGLWV